MSIMMQRTTKPWVSPEVRAFISAVGLANRHKPEVWLNFDTYTRYIGWIGSNGDKYKHPINEDNVGAVTQEEMDLIRVKVKLSTC